MDYIKFGGVLHCLDTEFSDFLLLEHLKVIEENPPKRFIDEKLKFRFPHDVKVDFLEELSSIQQKYNHRIEHLKELLNSGIICFFRAVENQQEIDYIVCNKQYIDCVIKEKNQNNEIIFLIPQYMRIPNSFPFKYYVLNINVYQGYYREGMRMLFDSNPELIKFCQNNYSSNEISKNKVFDLEKELAYFNRGISIVQVEKRAVKELDNAYRRIRIAESRCQRLLELATFDFNSLRIPNQMVIYGAGDIGTLFYEKISDKVKIECFLDKNIQSQYKGVPILHPENYSADPNIPIIVIPTYDFVEIKKCLLFLYGNKVPIIAFEDLIEKDK